MPKAIFDLLKGDYTHGNHTGLPYSVDSATASPVHPKVLASR